MEKTSFIKSEKLIPVNVPLLDGNEKKYLIECIDSGWISSEGPFVKKFEFEFSKYIGKKYGISVSNGSVALDLAVLSLGIGKGDEVILPSFTIISCASAIIRAGAIPVVVDCDPLTWNMDVSQIESKITKKTKAIMVVHIYGLPVDMDPVIKLAKDYKLFIIEDAAEAHGLEYKNKKCGSFGDVSAFSFYSNKHVTSGEGGMILTDNPEIYERCSSLKNLCFKKEQRFIHDEMGWNYRFTNLQAAVGLAQLEKLDEHLLIKKKMGKIFTNKLKSIDAIQLPIPKTSYAENNYWVYGIVVKDRKNNAINISKKLFEKGVQTRPFFWPIHKQPILKKMGLFNKINLPVSEFIALNGLYLPSGFYLPNDDLKFVCEKVIEVFK